MCCHACHPASPLCPWQGGSGSHGQSAKPGRGAPEGSNKAARTWSCRHLQFADVCTRLQMQKPFSAGQVRFSTPEAAQRQKGKALAEREHRTHSVSCRALEAINAGQVVIDGMLLKVDTAAAPHASRPCFWSPCVRRNTCKGRAGVVVHRPRPQSGIWKSQVRASAAHCRKPQLPEVSRFARP